MKKMNIASVGTMVAGAARVRRTAQSLSALGHMTNGDESLTTCGANLDAEAHAVRSWYVTLGDALVQQRTVPPSQIPDGDARRRLLECVHEAVAGRDQRAIRPALVLLWASQHLDNLWRLESHLGQVVSASGAPAGQPSGTRG